METERVGVCFWRQLAKHTEMVNGVTEQKENIVQPEQHEPRSPKARRIFWLKLIWEWASIQDQRTLVSVAHKVAKLNSAPIRCPGFWPRNTKVDQELYLIEVVQQRILSAPPQSITQQKFLLLSFV